MFISFSFMDEENYAMECGSVLPDTNHIKILDEDGNLRDIIPYANLRYASIISKKDYRAIVEEGN